jgi:hypothetical protein
LRTALDAGTYPEPEYIDVLVRRSAIEPDFYVREMLVWALIRHEAELVVNRLLPELKSEIPQARSQALHTLTKLDDKKLYRHISKELLFDATDFVAMTAWRAASKLVPEGHGLELGQILKHQLGRGNFEVQHALSRAFCAIGDSILGLLEEASLSTNEKIQEHAKFTLAIFNNPWSERKLALEFAKKVDLLLHAPVEADPL